MKQPPSISLRKLDSVIADLRERNETLQPERPIGVGRPAPFPSLSPK
jgi:hypothetical protein